MTVDKEMVKRLANLARIQLRDDEVAQVSAKLSDVFVMIERLQEVDIEGVAPLTSVIPMDAPMRADIINDGDMAKDILQNAPKAVEGFFAVPKVVE